MNKMNLIKNLISVQKKYAALMENNEMQTRWMLIDPIITDIWGFNKTDVIVEFPIRYDGKVSNDRADYVIMKDNKPFVIIEAKSLNSDLWSYKAQLSKYFKTILQQYDYSNSPLYGILTDGNTYNFFINTKDSMCQKSQMSLSLMDMGESVIEQFSSFCFIDMPISEPEYDVNGSYRIDEAYLAINEFENLNILYEIEKMYIKGKPVKITSIRKTYINILKELKDIRPGLLKEFANNCKIGFSLNKNSSSQILITDCDSNIYIDIPASKSMLIKRVVSILETTDIGLHNVIIKFKKTTS